MSSPYLQGAPAPKKDFLALKSGDSGVLRASRLISRLPVLSISMSRKLRHYLRNERRRAALTQADVAALLGGRWKGRICKYERGAIPPTEVALAYEAILGKPASELLGGTFDEVTFSV